MSEALLQLDAIHKSYWNGQADVQVLHSLTMQVAPGELLAVVGRSGSGKTTLLNLIGGLDRADSGRMLYQNDDVSGWSPESWDRYRQHQIGYIFQFNQLLPEFNALENAMIKGIIAGWSIQKAEQRASQLLGRLGLNHRLDHRPSQLSGGEQQRVAIARALMTEPNLILADEPTGNLDVESGQRIFDVLRELQAERAIACLLVTHNPELASRCDRILALEDATSYPIEQGVSDV